jgi:hypothetical protein
MSITRLELGCRSWVQTDPALPRLICHQLPAGGGRRPAPLSSTLYNLTERTPSYLDWHDHTAGWLSLGGIDFRAGLTPAVRKLGREARKLTDEVLVPVDSRRCRSGDRASEHRPMPMRLSAPGGTLGEPLRRRLAYHFGERTLIDAIPSAWDDQHIRMVWAQVVNGRVGITQVKQPHLTAGVTERQRRRGWPSAAGPRTGAHHVGHSPKVEHRRRQSWDLLLEKWHGAEAEHSARTDRSGSRCPRAMWR